MKRGFFLAVLVLSIFTTFGGFATPEKSYSYLPQIGGNSSSLGSFENSTASAPTQTNTTGFYKTCIDSGKTEEVCGNELKTLENANKTGVSDDVKNYAIELSKKEGTVKTAYENCVVNANGDLSKCTQQTEDYNNAKKAVDDFAKESGYSLSNASPNYVSRTGFDPSKVKTCSLFTDPLTCIDSGIAWFITHTLLEIAGWFLWLGSQLLDTAINWGILKFASWAPDGIINLWKLVRDALYLFIVFTGFYLVFMYIVGRDDKFKKFIPWLIMFALFVNFSLPISKAMIDMSNIVALNIYNSAVPLGTNQSAGSAIMNQLGLQSLLVGGNSPLSNTTSTPVALMSVAMILFAAWMFLQAAIMIMVRTLVLIFTLIGSPLLLIDSMVTIPAFGEHIKKIRSIFFNQLFMADVFMILFFLTLQIMKVLKPLETMGTNILSVSDAGKNIGLFFGISMMLLLLYFMMKITKSMSGEVGAIATGAVNTGIGMFAGGVAMRGAAFAGRSLIGSRASRILDSKEGFGKWIKNNQDTFIGKHALNLTNSLANSTFDARNTGIAKNFSQRTGVKLGTGGNVGYKQDLENTIKDRKERMALIDTKTDDGQRAMKRFQENAGYGGIINKVPGLFADKEKISKALGDSQKDTQRETIAKYKSLDDEKEKAEFLAKQDKATQEKINNYEQKVKKTEDERQEDRDLRKKSVDFQGDMVKAIQEQNKIAQGQTTKQEQPERPTENTSNPNDALVDRLKAQIEARKNKKMAA